MACRARAAQYESSIEGGVFQSDQQVGVQHEQSQHDDRDKHGQVKPQPFDSLCLPEPDREHVGRVPSCCARGGSVVTVQVLVNVQTDGSTAASTVIGFV